MEAVLVIVVFITTALALYALANERIKTSGACNVISLCLIVAIAYQFKVVGTIVLITLVVIALAIGIYLYLRKRKKDSNDKVIEYGGK